ncbi:MAG: hypothetical protein Q8Q62_01275 [Mesorhizobium sp.]|nr:hypothetical protein [Mesorhizobium sp.]
MRFVVIGLLLYALLFAGSEWLVRRNGHMNPIHKIETAQSVDYDWVILGASHAMPLDFDGFNEVMQAATGLRILNLAGPGTGPLYNRFVLEHFFRSHRASHILYVADAFAFRSPQWNEERLSDPKLLAKTPFSAAVAASLARYVLQKGVDPRALLDYATGFSKINNRDRFRPDVWEGEATFDRVFKPSATADRKRVDYLYPDAGEEGASGTRYLGELAELIGFARDRGADVTVIKPPLPSRFRKLLIDEAEFDGGLTSVVASNGASILDLSETMDDPRFYADTDHLNRAGAAEFFQQHLRGILLSDTP